MPVNRAARTKAGSDSMARGNQKGKPGFIRIIGGQWRGRRLPVSNLPGLRPTGDRARETLFNWLQPHLRGACCADLFAGTGALGLEAFSRGAADVTLIENTPAAAQALRAALANLQGSGTPEGLRLVEDDALAWLGQREPLSLDIVFVDPPFGSGLEAQALGLLNDRDLVRAGGLMYVETARGAPPAHPGLGWDIVRDKTLGEVRMVLFRKI